MGASKSCKGLRRALIVSTFDINRELAEDAAADYGYGPEAGARFVEGWLYFCNEGGGMPGWFDKHQSNGYIAARDAPDD